MRKYISTQKLPAMLVITGLLLLSFSVVLAQDPDQAAAAYTISWWTVDGGGGTTSGGGFTLMGTVGQPESGPVLTGGGFKLTSGFWPGELIELSSFNELFLPLVLR